MQAMVTGANGHLGFNLVGALRIRETLGWRQSITTEQSLRDTLETIRANRARQR